MRLQSGLVRQAQVQFLWYGTRASQEKSGAYLFLPSNEGARVGPEPGSDPNRTSFTGIHSFFLLQLYSSSEPPLVRVSRGPVYSDITSHFQHFTHRVRLYHLDGNRTFVSCYYMVINSKLGLFPRVRWFLSLQCMLGDPWRFQIWWTSGQRSTTSSPCGLSLMLPVATISTRTSMVFRSVPVFSKHNRLRETHFC